MADATEWQREIYFSSEVSLETPKIVPLSFPLPLPKPEHPVLASMVGGIQRNITDDYDLYNSIFK